MALITREQVEEFTGKFAADDATMPELYTQAATEAVVSYLGYNPELAEYAETVYGEGDAHLVTKAPVHELKSVNGAACGLGLYTARKNLLERRTESGALYVFQKNARFSLVYDGGFPVVPSKIVIAALQIASLLWESAGGNLAVSSTSFADAGTRVFNNYKIDRFLESINEYRCYHA